MIKNPIFIVVSAFVAIIAIWCIVFNNSMVSLQEQIEAKNKDNQQIYSSIRIKIEQSGLVANQYSDQVVRAIESAIGNRYGGGGAKGAMLWIKEQNPEINPATFTKVQQVVESEFTKFEANQTTLLDLGRVYKTKIRRFPNSMVAGLFGFKKSDIEPFMTVLTTQEAQRDFSTGTMTAPDTFSTSK